MSQTTASEVSSDTATETFDYVIVGAGISGIDAAVHLQKEFPDRTYVILEALHSFGGTWLTHTYPGVRSDSDLYTFGYSWKPWIGPPIATAPEIQTYLREAIEEQGLAPHIRYHHRVETATWSSEGRAWTITARRSDTGEAVTLRSPFLWMCQGYYRHNQGFTPDWPGLGEYQGRVVHPQTWPEDLELDGKRVVIIGSGATTATLAPAIAERCEHLTVLQRSPTYFWPAENRNELADQLRALEVPEEWVHEIVRRQVLKNWEELTRLTFEQPEFAKTALIENLKAHLPADYDLGTHFTPRYRPWQQRLAFVPDGDLFKGISAGLVDVVTDEIDHFTPTGIVTKHGTTLEADVVVTATGFNLAVLGDIDFTIDGEHLDLSTSITYRGMMFTGVPNLVWIFGYFRASWTLRADLVCEFMCRMFHHMHDLGRTVVTPQLRPEDADMELGAWIDPENFNPGYLMRSMHLMPHRGSKTEWQHNQDYFLERDLLPKADLDDGCLRYS